MGFLETDCTFRPFSSDLISACTPFDCGHPDLNDFFANDCINYSEQLLGKTYCFTWDKDPDVVVCAFTIANGSIKANDLPNARKKKVSKTIPQPKRMRDYPSVLIGRLGVNIKFKRIGIGRELMDFIKSWFVDSNNKTGCRFLVVDSYNEIESVGYYKSNGFEFLFSTEEQEKSYGGLEDSEKLKTRLMYFDLILLKQA